MSPSLHVLNGFIPHKGHAKEMDKREKEHMQIVVDLEIQERGSQIGPRMLRLSTKQY
jgi:hypothetical protein